MQKPLSVALCALTLGLSGGAVQAHVTLEQPEAAAGSTYRAVLRVGHGCDGQATQTLRVTLPEGFYNAKPMPKAGWSLKVEQGPYATPFDNHGKEMTSGAREISWSGGELADDWYDEFIIRGTVGPEVAPGTVLYFAAVQECAKGTADWTDVSGRSDVENPAPGVTVTMASAGMDHGHNHGAPAHDAQAAGHGHDHAAGHDAAMGAAPGAALRLGDLTLSGPFSRATPPGAPVAGGFVTIANGGAEDDRLISVRADEITDRAEIHEMAMQDAVMTMRQMPEGLPIPAGATVELKPGGYHMMFFDLKQPLAEGQIVKVTLEFEKAGEIELPLVVGPRNAGAGGDKAMKGGEHAGH
ncbi:MAG: DUF1775 domain-containing protein [Paracoccus sp. (in: a-proteobacteria)]